MAMMVWITVKVKDGNLDQVIELADEPHGNAFTASEKGFERDEPHGNAFTASEKGFERLERSISHENPNHILLTELWSSKEDWDLYFATQQKLRDENGWNARFLPLLEEDGVQITFSEMDKSL